jgi:hypothetical protein
MTFIGAYFYTSLDGVVGIITYSALAVSSPVILEKATIKYYWLRI